MFVPGGVGGVTGAEEMRGPEALKAPVSPGVTAALGVRFGPQAVRIEITRTARPTRTGQWYGRGRPEVRRGGGTGRRVGLKNRCPQGRPGSTPGLGTTPMERTPAAGGLRGEASFHGFGSETAFGGPQFGGLDRKTAQPLRPWPSVGYADTSP